MPKLLRQPKTIFCDNNLRVHSIYSPFHNHSMDHGQASRNEWYALFSCYRRGALTGSLWLEILVELSLQGIRFRLCLTFSCSPFVVVVRLPAYPPGKIELTSDPRETSSIERLDVTRVSRGSNKKLPLRLKKNPQAPKRFKR
jgi:hypothetical protein